MFDMDSWGMVTAVGLSNLQYVDLNSSRNTFILGVSLFLDLSLPAWLGANRSAIDTGYSTLDQIVTVLFSTNMFVGGLMGFVLDNTIPGTDKERGINVWRKIAGSHTTPEADVRVYDLPFQAYIDKLPFIRYFPFCPGLMALARAETDTNAELEAVGSDITLNTNNYFSRKAKR